MDDLIILAWLKLVSFPKEFDLTPTVSFGRL
jgi:hypothetical protein